jgi:uncharacterized phage-like protein YoqJ
VVSSLTVAGTGHRPEDAEDEGIVRIKARTKLRYPNKLGRAGTFICGMASGFDLWAGDEALDLGLEVIAARPWAGHEPRKADRELYDKIIAAASRVVNVHESEDYPGPWVYQKRNEWMVDNADVVMAYWSGKEKGGTWNCVEYTRKVKKPLTNIYHDPPF